MLGTTLEALTYYHCTAIVKKLNIGHLGRNEMYCLIHKVEAN